MAKTQNEVQKRLKILEKLISLGVTNEDDVKKLTLESLSKDSTITIPDMPLVCEMIESIKNGRLFSLIASGVNEVV